MLSADDFADLFDVTFTMEISSGNELSRRYSSSRARRSVWSMLPKNRADASVPGVNGGGVVRHGKHCVPAGVYYFGGDTAEHFALLL